MLACNLKMALSGEKTLVTHADGGFVVLGFHIRPKHRTAGSSRHPRHPVQGRLGVGGAEGQASNEGEHYLSQNWSVKWRSSTRSCGAVRSTSAPRFHEDVLLFSVIPPRGECSPGYATITHRSHGRSGAAVTTMGPHLRGRAHSL